MGGANHPMKRLSLFAALSLLLLSAAASGATPAVTWPSWWAGGCADAEAQNPGSATGCRYEAREENCSDGIDNDSDERADRADGDCEPADFSDQTLPEGSGEKNPDFGDFSWADAGWGNDSGQGVDCAVGGDPSEVSCSDGCDNDGDGLTDCEDGECSPLRECGGEQVCCVCFYGNEGYYDDRGNIVETDEVCPYLQEDCVTQLSERTDCASSHTLRDPGAESRAAAVYGVCGAESPRVVLDRHSDASRVNDAADLVTGLVEVYESEGILIPESIGVVDLGCSSFENLEAARVRAVSLYESYVMRGLGVRITITGYQAKTFVEGPTCGAAVEYELCVDGFSEGFDECGGFCTEEEVGQTSRCTLDGQERTQRCVSGGGDRPSWVLE